MQLVEEADFTFVFIILLHCKQFHIQDITLLNNGQNCDLHFDVNTVSVQLKCVLVFTPVAYVLVNFSHESYMKDRSPLQSDRSESYIVSIQIKNIC